MMKPAMYRVTRTMNDPDIGDGVILSILLPDNATSRGNPEYVNYGFSKYEALALADKLREAAEILTTKGE